MMKRVLILSGVSTNEKSTPYAKYFSEAISEYEFNDINFDHLVIEISPQTFSIKDGRTNTNLNDYDLVMIREYMGKYLDVAYVVSKYLEQSNTQFFNKNYLNYRPVSKIAQAVIMHQQKVKFPISFMSLNVDYCLSAAKSLDFPLIVKDTSGMHGSNNFLAKSAEELKYVFANNPEIKFIVQEFLPNTHDYRVLIMGPAPPLQIKRTAASGSHLNNTSQGGSGEFVNDLPDAVIEQAQRLTKAMDIDIGGADVLQNEKDMEYYFLEINNQPQLVTGAEVERKMDNFKTYLGTLLN